LRSAPGRRSSWAKTATPMCCWCMPARSEDAFMAAGHGTAPRRCDVQRLCHRRPAADPAGIMGMTSRRRSLCERLPRRRRTFVSRGDESGTHTKELSIWKKAGIEPGRRLVRLRRAGHGRSADHERRAAGLHPQRPGHLPGAHARQIEGTCLAIVLEVMLVRQAEISGKIQVQSTSLRSTA
jgi:hypothetical protein